MSAMSAMSALKTCVASAAITCAVGCTTSLWSPEPPRSFAGYRPDPDVVDGRGRFREIYTAVRADHGRELPADRPVADALHDLGDEPAGSTGAAGSAGTLPVHIGPPRTSLRIMIVPGLFGECVLGSLSPFSHARAHLAEHGYRTELILVSGRSSCEHNARQIRDALVTTRLDADDRLVLVGYSKGAVDSLVAVTEYPEVRDRVAAVVSMAGPIGGTSVADDLDGILSDMLRMLDVPGCPRGDGGAIDGPRAETRQAWRAPRGLPKEIRVLISVDIGNGDISRLHTSPRSSVTWIGTVCRARKNACLAV